MGIRRRDDKLLGGWITSLPTPSTVNLCTVRWTEIIVHDKSSLAPEGKPVAFCLDPETGFSWIGEYDITADELLSGAGGNTATKTEQAEKLILDLLADGKELASEDIVKAAAEAGISERTVQNAKRNMGGILGARRVGGQWYNFIKKKQPPEPAI